jgi:hypothetical protein
MVSDKQPTSFRLSEEALTVIGRLAEFHGVSQTAVVEMAVRQMGRRDLGDTAAPPPPKKGRGRR